MINVLINGANGKMGTILKDCILNSPDLCVKYEIDKNSPISLESLDKIPNKPDVIIDFSIPSASLSALDYAACHLVPIVVATTGFSDVENKKILEYSQAIPVFKASNMSYFINLIGKILKDNFASFSNMDIEIIEKHHKYKSDVPSGTSIFLADCINSACKNRYNYVFDRYNNQSARSNNEIGFSSVRGGSLVGEHSILFLGENESIEIKHTAYSRKIFAEGAICAARFIINQKNGLYSMNDLL